MLFSYSVDYRQHCAGSLDRILSGRHSDSHLAAIGACIAVDIDGEADVILQRFKSVLTNLLRSKSRLPNQPDDLTTGIRDNVVYASGISETEFLSRELTRSSVLNTRAWDIEVGLCYLDADPCIYFLTRAFNFATLSRTICEIEQAIMLAEVKAEAGFTVRAHVFSASSPQAVQPFAFAALIANWERAIIGEELAFEKVEFLPALPTISSVATVMALHDGYTMISAHSDTCDADSLVLNEITGAIMRQTDKLRLSLGSSLQYAAAHFRHPQLKFDSLVLLQDIASLLEAAALSFQSSAMPTKEAVSRFHTYTAECIAEIPHIQMDEGHYADPEVEVVPISLHGMPLAAVNKVRGNVDQHLLRFPSGKVAWVAGGASTKAMALMYSVRP